MILRGVPGGLGDPWCPWGSLKVLGDPWGVPGSPWGSLSVPEAPQASNRDSQGPSQEAFFNALVGAMCALRDIETLLFLVHFHFLGALGITWGIPGGALGGVPGRFWGVLGWIRRVP